ncbi:MAG: diguanylate cyclase [Myxococcales bacterium]|nr:diguanylate cyclase [Myxococcales bacterium]
MAGPAARRHGARQRLKSGFLAGLPEQLRDLVAILESDGTPETRASVAHSLKRISDTAGSLGLSGISREAGRLATRAHSSARLTFGPLVRELRSGIGTSPFAPIAFVGTERQLQSIAQQDDGVVEPLVLVPDTATLRELFTVDWPQAIVLPASEAPEVVALAGDFDCPLYLYGPSRDLAARRLATRVGADGYLADPIALPELLAHLRYATSRPTEAAAVALLGPPAWAEEQAERLRGVGLQAITPGAYEAVAATLHGVYPAAVVLGPGPASRTREAIAVMRQHIGRTHIAILAYGTPEELGTTGADDILSEDADLAARVDARLERFRDHRRDRDELTQVLNRAGSLEALQRIVARTERGDGPVSVALAFVGGLGNASVEHGREAANACRRHVAAALERGLRRVDLVGFLGEDTFLAVLVDCPPEHAAVRLEEIRGTVLSRVHADRRLRNITLTFGIASTLRGTRGLLLRAMEALDARRAEAP